MQVKEVTIGPAEAKAMLGQSSGFTNRHVSKERVRNYAHDMKDGKWVRNGETIIVDEEGAVIDGQHRLHAIVAADVSIPMLVAYGVQRSHAKTIDQGASRTVYNGLQMSGWKNSSAIIATVRSLRDLRAGVDPECDTGKRHNPDNNLSTVAEVESFLLKDAFGIGEFLGLMPTEARKAISLAELAAATYEFSLLESQTEAIEWATGFAGGCPPNDPRHLARERLIADRIAAPSLRYRNVASTRKRRLSILVMSWNLWVSGYDVTYRSFQVRSEAHANHDIVVPLSRVQACRQLGPDYVNRSKLSNLRRLA